MEEKKKFLESEIEIVRFDEKDVIRTSGEYDDNGDDTGIDTN